MRKGFLRVLIIYIILQLSMVVPILKNVFNFHFGSQDVCFSVSFANNHLERDIAVAQAKGVSAQCQHLKVGGMRPTGQFLWCGSSNHILMGPHAYHCPQGTKVKSQFLAGCQRETVLPCQRLPIVAALHSPLSGVVASSR